MINALTHNEILELFARVGEFRSNGKTVEAIIDKCSDAPCVYVWVAEHTKSCEIIYVGKAGFGLRVRHHTQHNPAFRKQEGRGWDHALYLGSKLKSGAIVGIWRFEPPCAPLFGTAIPMHSSAEDYILAHITPYPVRNWASRNRATVADQT